MRSLIESIPQRPLPYRTPPPKFLAELARLPIHSILNAGAAADEARCRAAMEESPLSLEGAASLLAGRSAPRLPEILERARSVTDRTFGRTILLYAPCYLSSYCVNHCRYCRFNFTMQFERRFLPTQDAEGEVKLLGLQGMRKILLVAGDFPSKVTPEYLEQVIEKARSIAGEIDLEVAPTITRIYRTWARSGAGGVTCYQETYDGAAYSLVHPRGPKSSYVFRLGTLERAGAGGMKRLGLGVLLGLAEPYSDILALIAHARFLGRFFPRARISVSLPRLCPAVPSYSGPYAIDLDTLLRFYAVLRMALPSADLVGSTRELPEVRKRLLEAGITQMSAGSVTVPGGYGERRTEGGQFDISDHRCVAEVVEALEGLGYLVRWTGEARPVTHHEGERN